MSELPGLEMLPLSSGPPVSRDSTGTAQGQRHPPGPAGAEVDQGGDVGVSLANTPTDPRPASAQSPAWGAGCPVVPSCLFASVFPVAWGPGGSQGGRLGSEFGLVSALGNTFPGPSSVLEYMSMRDHVVSFPETVGHP